MAKFLYTYHGGVGMETTEEKMAEVMALWGAWFAELGDAIVDGGAPVGASKTVGAAGAVSDGGGANPATGYTILSANSLDEAVTMAKGCPSLADGGSVEVSELIEM
ncbi:MAG: YciI family protein [Acidimicrobiia bacterium]